MGNLAAGCGKTLRTFIGGKTMKKEDLMKKAAERGITLSEEQAEKYATLSDEELENIDVSGGASVCPPDNPASCFGPVYGDGRILLDGNYYYHCAYCTSFGNRDLFSDCFNTCSYYKHRIGASSESIRLCTHPEIIAGNFKMG
jgi:hypothetical protein